MWLSSYHKLKRTFLCISLCRTLVQWKLNRSIHVRSKQGARFKKERECIDTSSARARDPKNIFNHSKKSSNWLTNSDDCEFFHKCRLGR